MGRGELLRYVQSPDVTVAAQRLADGEIVASGSADHQEESASRITSRRRRRLAGAGVFVLAGLLPATIASARPPIDDGGGGGIGGGLGGGLGGVIVGVDCLGESTGSLSVSPQEIVLGETATLHWSVDPLPGCAARTQSISGGIGAVSSGGSLVVQPVGPISSWTLQGRDGSASRDLAQASLAVHLPQSNGRPDVTISSDDQVGIFLQAIAEPGAIIRIDNDVALDLSYMENLHLAAGVTIVGARSPSEPGAKLYTTTFPRRLFIINQADNVSISGIRLQGGEMGTADEDAEISNGISVSSSVNVTILNNEISGWRGAAIEVRDPLGKINLANYDAVRVQENYIHHNQQYGEEGYGVATYDSAYALIEKNLFDYNRHAIASAGVAGTGYYAHSNLVLQNGGMNNGTWNINTHMLDVHGTEDCWGFGKYCGPAGEKFDIRHNTILYDGGTAIKVRGEPSIGAFVDKNVFTHSQVWGGYLDDAALVQTTGHNLYATNNQFGRQFVNMIGTSPCDFNADGTLDRFVATGQTWWFWSDASGAGRYTFLNTSTKSLSQLTLSDVNGDGACDVTDDDGVVYLSGSTAIPLPPSPLPVVPDVRGDTVFAATSALTAQGFTKGPVTYVDDPTCNDIGRVTSQTPPAGTHAEAGTAVQLSVGQQPPHPCL
jgi:hypothetical protein